MAGLRRYRRMLLLVVLPLVALIGGLVFYLKGGRYVTTDDAYVGAQKVLITPDISGKIDKVVVHEGQRVKQGDVLFEIDPVPFRLAVQQAKATLDQAKTTYDNLVANIKIYDQMVDLMQQGVDLKQRDVDRKSTLVKSNFGSQLDLDNSSTALVTARAQLALRPAADVQREDPAARQSRSAARAVSALRAGQGRARPGRAQPRSHRDARADRRHRHPGRPDPARPLRRGRHAGVQRHRHRQALGRRQSEGIRTSPMSRSGNRSTSTSMRSRTMSSRAPSVRSAPAPARNSRSCRRRTPPATSSRWCSACRCGSISTAMTNMSRS